MATSSENKIHFDFPKKEILCDPSGLKANESVFDFTQKYFETKETY